MDCLVLFCFLKHQTPRGPFSHFPSASGPSPQRGLCEHPVERRRPPSPRSMTLATLFLVSRLALWRPCPELGAPRSQVSACVVPCRSLTGMSGLNGCLKGCLSLGSEGEGPPPTAAPQSIPGAPAGGIIQRQMGPQSDLSLPPSAPVWPGVFSPTRGPEHFDANTFACLLLLMGLSFSRSFLDPEGQAGHSPALLAPPLGLQELPPQLVPLHTVRSQGRALRFWGLGGLATPAHRGATSGSAGIYGWWPG